MAPINQFSEILWLSWGWMGACCVKRKESRKWLDAVASPSRRTTSAFGLSKRLLSAPLAPRQPHTFTPHWFLLTASERPHSDMGIVLFLSHTYTHTPFLLSRFTFPLQMWRYQYTGLVCAASLLPPCLIPKWTSRTYTHRMGVSRYRIGKSVIRV